MLKEIKAAGVSSIKHIFYASVRDDDYSLTVDNGETAEFSLISKTKPPGKSPGGSSIYLTPHNKDN